MSTLTILTRKSMNKDQWFFISPGSSLEGIDWLNNASNSDNVTSLNIFYSETGEIFFKITLEQPCWCFLWFVMSDVDTLNTQNLKKHNIDVLTAWNFPLICTENLLFARWISSSMSIYVLISHMGYIYWSPWIGIAPLGCTPTKDVFLSSWASPDVWI